MMRRIMKSFTMSILLMAGVLASCGVQQKAVATKQAETTETADLDTLRIDIHNMSTLRYGARTVTPDFFLELRGDSLISYLPYMGQSHGAALTSYPAQGLNFETRIMNYQRNWPKPHMKRIELDAKTQEDTYHYIIEVYDSGAANIRVRSMYKDPVGFDGESVPLPD